VAPLRLEVEGPHVTRPEDSQRPAIERGDPVNPESLGGGDQ